MESRGWKVENLDGENKEIFYFLFWMGIGHATYN